MKDALRTIYIFACTFFSSGICGVSGDTISVEEIVSYFKENDDLLGKPKLFFIQACRAGVEDDKAGIDHEKTLCPPKSSDILVAYSTIYGKSSYRDIDNGSWFIQTLLKQISMHAYNEHLMDIMIMVNKKIATSGLEDKKQMPQQVSTLTKFVYFKMAEVGKVLEAKNSILSREGTSARMRSNSLAVYNNEHGEFDCVAAIKTRPRSLSDYRSDHTDTWTRPRSQSDNNDDSESGRGDIPTTFASTFSPNHNHDSEHIVVQPQDLLRVFADLISSFNGGRK